MMSLRKLWPLFAIAFIVGLLFRLGHKYDLAVFRMFGTLGIVIVGILAASYFGRQQQAGSEERFKQALTHVRERWPLLGVDTPHPQTGLDTRFPD